ncbi:hypothetical protein OBBRIDRAFT_482472 [Obba rivulosa]|uniref:Uncharacterized protein n=1 Tax=Obba rivulosa TaxID=1052685 RepID=A0A8E2AGR8_9APHY|nr:hypothetical protein OBBRIDRAFT_482472 [Obba rivulosa]
MHSISPASDLAVRSVISFLTPTRGRPCASPASFTRMRAGLGLSNAGDKTFFHKGHRLGRVYSLSQRITFVHIAAVCVAAAGGWATYSFSPEPWVATYTCHLHSSTLFILYGLEFQSWLSCFSNALACHLAALLRPSRKLVDQIESRDLADARKEVEAGNGPGELQSACGGGANGLSSLVRLEVFRHIAGL